MAIFNTCYIVPSTIFTSPLDPNEFVIGVHLKLAGDNNISMPLNIKLYYLIRERFDI